MSLPTTILVGDEIYDIITVQQPAITDAYGDPMKQIFVMFKGAPVLGLIVSVKTTDDKIMNILEEALDLGSVHL